MNEKEIFIGNLKINDEFKTENNSEIIWILIDPFFKDFTYMNAVNNLGQFEHFPQYTKVIRYQTMISRFGSHKSMVDKKSTNNLNEPNKVVCRDEYGLYVTDKKYLDNGFADPNRFNKNRMERFVSPQRDWVH